MAWLKPLERAEDRVEGSAAKTDGQSFQGHVRPGVIPKVSCGKKPCHTGLDFFKGHCLSSGVVESVIGEDDFPGRY